ncbi:hypothetical protein CsSME_00041311 [Camellia sinensis var. sinensis]
MAIHSPLYLLPSSLSPPPPKPFNFSPTNTTTHNTTVGLFSSTRFRPQTRPISFSTHLMNSNFSAAVVFGEDFPADYTEWLPKRNPYDRRRAGVLLHPTSFPGPYGIGDLGDQAFRFLDWLNHSGCSLWQVRRDLRLLQSAHIEEIVSSSFQVIHGTKPKQKVQLLESTAKAMEHKKLRVCVDSAMELMNEVVMSILFPAALFLIFSIVNIWFAPISSTAKEVTIVTFSVAVMTRTYPEDSGERKELILLQNIASYKLLACGAVYLISLKDCNVRT